MSGDISRSAFLQVNVGTENATGNLSNLAKSFGEMALKGTDAFRVINSSIDGTVVKVDSSISAFDRFIKTVENSAKRATAAKWLDGLDNVEAELKRIQQAMLAVSASPGLDESSAEAAQLAANLDKVRSQLERISAIRPAVSSQANIAGIVQGSAETARYQAWLQQNADPSIQGYRSASLYDLDLSNVNQLRQPHGSFEQNDYMRYQSWLQKNADPSVQGYRSTQLYDIDLSNTTSLRKQADADEMLRYRRWFADREEAPAPQTYIQSGPTSAEAMVTHQSYLSDLAQKRAEARQRDRDAQDRIRREETIRMDRLNNDPSMPNYYDQRYRDELTGDFKRDRWVSDNRAAARRNQLGSPNLLDEDDLNRRHQQWQMEGGPAGTARRQFIGQQLAFAVDDASQQFMWSNSTGAGISAAARAAGNNLSAVAANMDMSPSKMMGAMVAVQGISALVGYLGKMADESLKAAKSTETLEKAVSRYGQQVDRQSRFQSSIRKGSAEQLSDAQLDADAELAATNKKLQQVRDLQNPQNRLMNENRPTNSWGEWASRQWGTFGWFETDASRKYLAYEGAMSRRDELAKNANELAIEKKALEAEKIERERVLAERSRREERNKVRSERGAALGDSFDYYLEDMEAATGQRMSGAQIQDAYDYMVAENPDADLSDTKKGLEARKRRADQMIKVDKRDAEQFYAETKSTQEFENKVRDNPFANILRDFNDFVKEVKDKTYLTEEQQNELISDRRSQVDKDISKRQKEMDESLQRSYKPLEGITISSEQDTELKARLTALTGNNEATEQTEILKEIATNTRPRPAQPDQVVSLGANDG